MTREQKEQLATWDANLETLDKAIHRARKDVRPDTVYEDAFIKVVKAWNEFSVAHWG